MFLIPQKRETIQASKAIKKRPSLVNLIHRHFHSPSSSAATPGKDHKDQPASVSPPLPPLPPPSPSPSPPPPLPQSLSRGLSRKHPKTQFTTSAPEPRASRSTASLDAPASSYPTSLLPPHRPSHHHRRSQSANPSYTSAAAPSPASPPAPAPAPSPAPTYDDLFKTQNQTQTRRESESDSNWALERKIWPAQHRYSQEIMKMCPEHSTDTSR